MQFFPHNEVNKNINASSLQKIAKIIACNSNEKEQLAIFYNLKLEDLLVISGKTCILTMRCIRSIHQLLPIHARASKECARR